MRRRKVLTLAGTATTALAGCIGGSKVEETPSNSSQETQGGSVEDSSESGSEQCIEKPSVSGVMPASVEVDGVEIEFDQPVPAREYTQYDPKPAQVGATFMAIPFTATVTGDTKKELGGEYMLENLLYFGEEIKREAPMADTIKIDGEEFDNFVEKVTGVGPELYPGDSTSGAFLFQVPKEYEPGALIAPISPVRNDTANVAVGGNPSELKYPCPSYSLPEGPLPLGETVTFDGIEYGIKDVIETDSMTAGGQEMNAPEGATYILIQIMTKVVGERPQSFPNRPTVKYSGDEPDAPGVVLRRIKANNENYIGYFSPKRRQEGRRVTDGRTLYPGVEIEGVVAHTLPKDFDTSKISIQQSFGDKQKTVSWSIDK